MKVRTNILIEESVLRKAQELGVNVSKATENYLKILIETIEKTNMQIQQQNQTVQEKGGSAETPSGFSQWTGRDLNPRPPECESGVHTN